MCAHWTCVLCFFFSVLSIATVVPYKQIPIANFKNAKLRFSNHLGKFQIEKFVAVL